MDLPSIRKRINLVDFELLKLLNHRMELALSTKKLKKKITDTKREDEVINYIKKHSQGLIEPNFCAQLFTEIIKESKRLQTKDYQLIGFHGEHGVYDEQAAREFDSHLVTIPFLEYGDIFEDLEKKQLDFGIVPIENATQGTLTSIHHLLAEKKVFIIGEVELPIKYHLLTLPETKPDQLRIVYSHAHALNQCNQYVKHSKLESRSYSDIASADKMLSKKRPQVSAVIGNELCAELYNLKIVKRNIKNPTSDRTRFIVLSSNSIEKSGKNYKNSIAFSIKNEIGGLSRIVNLFAQSVVNILRIESVPNKHKPGEYIFFLDFAGNIKSKKVQDILQQTQENTIFYKFLGSYSVVA